MLELFSQVQHPTPVAVDPFHLSVLASYTDLQLRCSGSMTGSEALAAERLLVDIVKACETAVVVLDLREVTDIDWIGVRAVTNAMSALASKGVRLTLVPRANSSVTTSASIPNLSVVPDLPEEEDTQ